ncbi:hypothetical protein LOTGIDRAFT_157516 [Lottia gigantea]|uniref:Uncharacterized protein n=1 Tax=Lottia gigantea TaxID=225164 RepID=V4B5N1_LOTGI|nr:hypothetical protein LOTGIDRAFT_157516 [Lottia gigantea]ESP01337.1 hypothetical protein LOTGIDRAFT_157516 [Lottia gigantea]
MARLGPSTPQWTSSLKSLPSLKEVDIENWAKQGRIPKAVHTKGYGSFVESYVHVVEVRTLIDGCCVRARCFKLMKKHDQPHSVGLKLSTSHHEESESTGSQKSSSRPNDVDIRECLCSCKAGKGDRNHILGLMYLIHHYSKYGFKTVPTVTTKTSQKQTWHIPE